MSQKSSENATRRRQYVTISSLPPNVISSPISLPQPPAGLTPLGPLSHMSNITHIGVMNGNNIISFNDGTHGERIDDSIFQAINSVDFPSMMPHNGQLLVNNNLMALSGVNVIALNSMMTSEGAPNQANLTAHPREKQDMKDTTRMPTDKVIGESSSPASPIPSHSYYPRNSPLPQSIAVIYDNNARNTNPPNAPTNAQITLSPLPHSLVGSITHPLSSPLQSPIQAPMQQPESLTNTTTPTGAVSMQSNGSISHPPHDGANNDSANGDGVRQNSDGAPLNDGVMATRAHTHTTLHLPPHPAAQLLTNSHTHPSDPLAGDMSVQGVGTASNNGATGISNAGTGATMVMNAANCLNMAGQANLNTLSTVPTQAMSNMGPATSLQALSQMTTISATLPNGGAPGPGLMSLGQHGLNYLNVNMSNVPPLSVGAVPMTNGVNVGVGGNMPPSMHPSQMQNVVVDTNTISMGAGISDQMGSGMNPSQIVTVGGSSVQSLSMVTPIGPPADSPEANRPLPHNDDTIHFHAHDVPVEGESAADKQKRLAEFYSRTEYRPVMGENGKRRKWPAALKVLIVQESKECGTMKTAQKFGCHARQIQRWAKNVDDLQRMDPSMTRVPGSGRPPWRPDLQNLIAEELRDAHSRRAVIDYNYIRDCFRKHLAMMPSEERDDLQAQMLEEEEEDATHSHARTHNGESANKRTKHDAFCRVGMGASDMGMLPGGLMGPEGFYPSMVGHHSNYFDSNGNHPPMLSLIATPITAAHNGAGITAPAPNVATKPNGKGDPPQKVVSNGFINSFLRRHELHDIVRASANRKRKDSENEDSPPDIPLTHQHPHNHPHPLALGHGAAQMPPHGYVMQHGVPHSAQHGHARTQATTLLGLNGSAVHGNMRGDMGGNMTAPTMANAMNTTSMGTNAMVSGGMGPTGVNGASMGPGNMSGGMGAGSTPPLGMHVVHGNMHPVSTPHNVGNMARVLGNGGPHPHSHAHAHGGMNVNSKDMSPGMAGTAYPHTHDLSGVGANKDNLVPTLPSFTSLHAVHAHAHPHTHSHVHSHAQGHGGNTETIDGGMGSYVGDSGSGNGNNDNPGLILPVSSLANRMNGPPIYMNGAMGTNINTNMNNGGMGNNGSMGTTGMGGMNLGMNAALGMELGMELNADVNALNMGSMGLNSGSGLANVGNLSAVHGINGIPGGISMMSNGNGVNGLNGGGMANTSVSHTSMPSNGANAQQNNINANSVNNSGVSVSGARNHGWPFLHLPS